MVGRTHRHLAFYCPPKRAGLESRMSVSVCVSVLIDQSGSSSMSMLYGPILIDQSEDREGVEGECVSWGSGSQGRR